jgi:hypothetical protein
MYLNLSLKPFNYIQTTLIDNLKKIAQNLQFQNIEGE